MASFERLHNEVSKRAEKFYIDPSTRYQVFTELAHKERGKSPYSSQPEAGWLVPELPERP